MSYESTAEPIKVGYLMDFTLPPGFPEELFASFTQTFDLIFEEAVAQGLMDRPVQMIYREVEGLPKGSVKAVIDAYGELVDEGCLVVFGPNITDNCVPLREAIEERFKVPAISVTGTDDWLGEWTFAFPQGSMTDEPIFLADLIAKRGLAEIGVLVEQSLIGESYLKNLRSACRRKGIRIVAEVAIAQTAQDINAAVQTLHEAKAEAIVHLGFGFGIVFINPALESVGWDPPRFTTTAWQNAWVNPIMWNAFMGWTGVDQYDEANQIGQDFLDAYANKYNGSRPEFCVTVVNRDVAATLVRAFTDAHPLSPRGVKEALERVEDDAGRLGRARHPGVVRQVDPPGLDGRRVSGGADPRCRRCEFAPGRSLRRGRLTHVHRTSNTTAGRRKAAPRVGEKRGWGGWVAGAALAAFALFFIANCRVALDPRVANPNVQGRPRPVKFLFGLDYITFLDVSTVDHADRAAGRLHQGLAAQSGKSGDADVPVHHADRVAGPDHELVAVRGLQPRSHPLAGVVAAGVVVADRRTLRGVRLRDVLFRPLLPGDLDPAQVQARKGPEAFVSRHPLVSLGLITCVIGFIMDAWLEIQLVHAGMYIYSQVIPWGSVFTGTTFQFPLIWESFSVTFVMVPAAILCYRDDTGKSVAEKLAAKAKIFPTRPVLGTFLVMFAIINVSYFAYGAWFWAIKVSHAATSVACPWPYPEAKVYDPQGFYEKGGAQGPYSVGIWSTWASGEPNGRPHVDPPPAGVGPCASKNG